MTSPRPHCPKPTEDEYKLTKQLQSPKPARKDSFSKFLKRKPDAKKVMIGASSRKKRESSISDYFAVNTQSQVAYEGKTVSNDRIINLEKVQSRSRSKNNEEYRDSLLQSVKSQDNLFSKRSGRETQANNFYHQNNRVSKGSFISKGSSDSDRNFQQSQSLIGTKDQYSQLCPRQRLNSKKSKTQFFIYEQMKGLSDQTSKNDPYQLNSTRQNGDLSQQYQKFRLECENLTKKNKLLQQQVELYTERNYLIQTEKKHLEEMLKEKDKIIDRLQRQNSLFKNKGKGDDDRQLQKHKEQLKQLKTKLSKEEQNSKALRMQVQALQNEVNSKNEELMLVYDQYTDLQAGSRKQQSQLSACLEQMKKQIDKMKQQQFKPESSENALGHAQKWKEKAFKLQEEVKYLQIQNQCLLISKQELTRFQTENRKLREERDYFKKKIMQNIKRNSKNHMKEFSRSDNSIVAFELSELSIDS